MSQLGLPPAVARASIATTRTSIATTERAKSDIFSPQNFPRHWQFCYVIAKRIVLNDALAREVAQEALLAAWRYRDRYDATRGTPERWLAAMTRHKAVDGVRREQNHRRCADRAARLVDREAPADPAEVLTRSATCQEVQGALATLTPPHREILTLAYYGGLSQREIAQRTHLPLGTVKSRTVSALRRLREHWDGQHE